MFRKRGAEGTCSVCKRQTIIGKLGRCRRCLVKRSSEGIRDPGRPMLNNKAFGKKPFQLPSIQLFFAGLRDTSSSIGETRIENKRRWFQVPSKPEQLPYDFVPGQTRLFWHPAESSRLVVDEALRQVQPEHPGLLGSVNSFADARGWPDYIARGVRQAIGIAMALRSGEDSFDSSTLSALVDRDLPIARTIDFLADHGINLSDPDSLFEAKIAERLAPLRLQIRIEVEAWIEVVQGRWKRRTKPRANQTILNYVSNLEHVLADWSERYDSLREVTADEVAAIADPLNGWERGRLVTAMRSMFKALRARNMIFADPTTRLYVGGQLRTPPLSLDLAQRESVVKGMRMPAQKLVMMLTGVHALTSRQIVNLRLEDLSKDHFKVNGQQRRLDDLTRECLDVWLSYRRERWPRTANPFVLVTTRSAHHVGPASRSFINYLFRVVPTTAKELRADRLVWEAEVNGGDPLLLAMMFGMSPQAAMRYAPKPLVMATE